MTLSLPFIAALSIWAAPDAPAMEVGVSLHARTAAVQVQPPGSAPTTGDWEATYRSGRAMFISGIVITAAGALVAAGSGFFVLLSLVMGDVHAVLPGAGWAALAGACVMVVGIPLLVVGIVKKRRASRMKAGLAMVTTVQQGQPVPTISVRF